MTLQFEVFVQNKPGDVAWVAEALSKNSVNIRGISTDLGGPRGIIRVVTDDEASARSALKAARLEFTERPVEVIALSDRPGELVKLARALSKAGLNIESMYILGNSGSAVEEIAVAVDDTERAREIFQRVRA